MERSGCCGKTVEEYAKEIHKIFCDYYFRRYGKEYWTCGKYELLDEETKEADRAVARFVQQAITDTAERVRKETIEECKMLARREYLNGVATDINDIHGTEQYMTAWRIEQSIDSLLTEPDKKD